MSMDWANERYVRLYTRDTPEWLCLSFLAQGLFALLMRKVSRAGVIELGKVGRRGVFIAIGHGHQAAMLDPALDELLADGCVQINGTTLVIPNFLEAQETPASDAQRQRNHREKARDNALGSRKVTSDGHEASREPDKRDGPDTNRDSTVTGCDETVTGGHGVSRSVTPSLAVPSVPPEPGRSARPRPKLVSGLGAADPCPATTAVLAGLYDRGFDAAPPSDKQAARVEAAVRAAGVDVAILRLVAVYANPNAEKPLTYHIDTIRGETPVPEKRRGTPRVDEATGEIVYEEANQ